MIPFNSKKYRTKYRNDGTVKKYGLYLNEKVKEPVSRFPPSFKYFQPTRTISNNQLDELSQNLDKENGSKNSFDFIINKNSLPYSLFDKTYTKNSIIKKKKEKTKKFSEVKNRKIVDKSFLLTRNETDDPTDFEKVEEKHKQSSNTINFKKKLKGQSARIFGELYKVIDSSNVVLQIIDARDPIGTFNEKIFNYLKNKTVKPTAIILNKVDLVPTNVTAQWLKILTAKYNIPILPFHASSLKNNYGKTSLMNLLRQYSRLFRKSGKHDLEKGDDDSKVNNLQSVTIGVIGMPNVGKSSVINILAMKKSCKVAPISGETKNWQYVSIAKNLYLLDCPGVVDEMEINEAIKRGAIRVERLTNNEIVIGLRHMLKDRDVRKAVEDTYSLNFYTQDGELEKEIKKGDTENKEIVKSKENSLISKIDGLKSVSEFINKSIVECNQQKNNTEYNSNDTADIDRFIEDFGRKFGKLKKGGIVCEFTVCQIILNDYLRGKISYYQTPPEQ